MTVFNKIIGKPSGNGVGQSRGGTGEFVPLSASLSFVRDDFSYASLDADVWAVTPQTGSGSYFCSDGRFVVDLGTSSTATFAMNMRQGFKVPFRVLFAASVDGISTGMNAFLRVRDSGSTWLAQWDFVGSAGGTEHTASTEVRAGSTAVGYIASAAVDPSAVAVLVGSGALGYVIDVDYNMVTFAMHTSAVSSTAALTAIPPVPKVLSCVPSPVLKQNQVYYVEVAYRSGTAAVPAAATCTADNASAYLRLDFVQVLEYSADAAFQTRQNAVQVFSATTATGATAVLGLTQLKWG
jgi:hypothetical protein